MTNAGKSPKVIKADVMAFVHDAFEGIGANQGITGLEAFTNWASNPANQSQFYTQIWSKLIPKDIKSSVTGENGGPVKLIMSWDTSTIEDAELSEDD